jgi:RND family efflux transporter MFP subunit
MALGAHWEVRRGAAASEPSSTTMGAMPGMGAAPPATPAGAASNAVYIPPARQQLIGVRTGRVQRERVEGTVRTVGVLAYDETHVAQIHTKVAGWIDRVFVDFVGKPVRRGQPLFSVYSPDLVTAQADYLIALRARPRLLEASPESRTSADALLVAARQRLERWDIGEAEVAALERRGEPSKTLTLSSPFDGVVLERNALAGQYLTPDMSAFKIGDLSTIWVLGQMFEYEAAGLRPGQTLDVEFPYGQAPRSVSARVDFVYPDVDPQTRRVRFRASLSNREGRLKPDTYVTVVLHGEPVDRLVVPASAVIDTGARKYAMLALADGYFEPRDVEVGPPLGDFYPVVTGLAEGDRVVTSAQFLVDSETNLMSAMQNMAMTMPGMDMGQPPSAPTSRGPAPSAMPPMPGMSGTPDMPGMANTPSAPASPPAASTTSAPVEGRAAPAVHSAPASDRLAPTPRAPAPPPPSSATAVPAPTMPAMPDMPGMDMPMPSAHAHGASP